MVDLLLISLIKGFQQVLRLLPERLSSLAGILLGRTAFGLLLKRREVACANARRILPDISEARAREIARSCFQKLGVNFIEILLLPYLPRKAYGQRFKIENSGYLEEALRARKGVLALGFHYANWEISGVVSFLLGREIIALARPLKRHVRLNAFLNGLRTAAGLTIIANQDTARDVVRLLHENRIVAFLGDQREKRSKGVWTEFFGQKVPTSKGIVAISMKTGAPVVPVYLRREGFLRYTVVVSRPLPMERRGAAIEELIYRNTRKINTFLEGIVTAHPDEWFLVHRRFGRGT